MFGKAGFFFKAFTTCFARKGRERGRVDSLYVSVQVRFLCKAFSTTVVWAREARGPGGVDGGDVFDEAAFLCEAFIT